MSDKVRVASLPNCDLCAQNGVQTPAWADGRTLMGQWANMCKIHFATYGVGLGTGRGQQLVLAEAKPVDILKVDTYEAWMRKVNRVLAGRVGLTADDLEDFDSWSCYDSGMTPEEGAEECLSNSDTYSMWGE